MRACIYTKCLCFPHMLFYIFTMCRYVCVREREKKKKKGTRWWFSLNKLLTSFVLFSFYAFFSVLDIYFFKDPSRQRTSKKKKRRFFYLVYVFSSLMDYWAAPVFMPALNKITGMIDWTRKWLTLMCGANDILYEVLNLTSVHFVARKWSVITEQFFSWIYLFNKQLANSDFLFLLSLTTPLFFHIFLYFNRL